MNSRELDQVAEQLFGAFVAHDFNLVASLLAPDATLSQNGSGGSFALARPMLERMRSIIGDHHYEDVRRVTGDYAVIEEHRVVATTPAGLSLNLAACVVVRVNDVGLISSIDEYVDLSTLKKES